MRISDWSSDVCSSDLDKPEVQEADLVIGLARCMLKTQQYEQAAKLFSQVQEKLPKHPEILVGLASCRRHKGALGEAEKLVRQVLAAEIREDAATMGLSVEDYVASFLDSAQHSLEGARQIGRA